MPTPLETWQPFLSTIAESAATLTGLVFVAVSINLQPILAVPGRTSLAAEALLQLLGPLFLALAALAPTQSLPALGIELLLLNGITWFVQTRLEINHLRRKTSQSAWLLRRLFRSQAACFPVCIAGVFLLRGSTTGLFWLAAGLLLSFYGGLSNAWVLLIEILR